QELLPVLRRNEDRSFLEQAQRNMRDWRKILQEFGTWRDTPMKPEVVAYELNKRLSGTAIISSDSGTIATWAARYFDIRRGHKFSLSGTWATMAKGLPSTIAAQIAYPDRQCVAFVGDGGFAMLMGEFATAVQYKLPIKVVVIKNNSLAQIKWEQMVFLGNPEYGCELHPIDFVKVAEACGVVGFHCAAPAEVRPALSAALQHNGPAPLDAVADPDH